MCRTGRNWQIWILYEESGSVIFAMPEISKIDRGFYLQGSRHALPEQLTRIRRPYGTWKILLSAALFPT